MCGIICAIAKENITTKLLAGLKRLEYRGYDSSGLAIISNNTLKRYRALGKIAELENIINNKKLSANIGIAHTRWATHGKPSEKNAHPHICNNKISVVHNGIIENYLSLKEQQLVQGYKFTSETDTEVIAHSICNNLKNNNLLNSTSKTCKSLTGSYAIGVISPDYSGHLVVSCYGTPLVIGIADNGYFVASDVNALLHITKKFIFLQDGDIADIEVNKLTIYNKNGKLIKPSIKTSSLTNNDISLGEHKHYMHKEIFDQPQAIIDILEGRCDKKQLMVNAFGYQAEDIFKSINNVQIVACGTSYHAGLVAKYWFEDIIKMPCAVEVASEYRYRNPVILDNTLFVSLSQSGETADTIEALLKAKKCNNSLKTLTICNTPESRLTRISDITFLTQAGPEISVASTKAFSSQLVALSLLMVAIGKVRGSLTKKREQLIISGLNKLPRLIKSSLQQEQVIAKLANKFNNKHNALFLGRGVMYPIAKEGALKLKEISYIHAEAYPAGELKHGPIALIDEHIPVIAIAPKDDLLEKLKLNLQEVKARGSEMIVFEDKLSKIVATDNMEVIAITDNVGRITAPIVFNISLQLLSYHVGLMLGTDIDKPRNLAKSVTVE